MGAGSTLRDRKPSPFILDGDWRPQGREGTCPRSRKMGPRPRWASRDRALAGFAYSRWLCLMTPIRPNLESESLAPALTAFRNQVVNPEPAATLLRHLWGFTAKCCCSEMPSPEGDILERDTPCLPFPNRELISTKMCLEVACWTALQWVPRAEKWHLWKAPNCASVSVWRREPLRLGQAPSGTDLLTCCHLLWRYHHPVTEQ